MQKEAELRSPKIRLSVFNVFLYSTHPGHHTLALQFCQRILADGSMAGGVDGAKRISSLDMI